MIGTVTAVLKHIKADLAQVLDAPTILALCHEVGYQWCLRLLDPVTTVHLCILQILHRNTAPFLERDPAKGAEWLRAGFEAHLADLYQQWQALRIVTARCAELLGLSPWELADLLRARGFKMTNLPG